MGTQPVNSDATLMSEKDLQPLRKPQKVTNAASASMVRNEKLFVITCLVIYMGLAVLLANVRPPQSDEGHFAEGAMELATTGRLITPTWTEWLPTLNRHVYAAMPLYFVSLAAWFRVFGIGMLSMRYFSVLWGVALVFSYFVLVKKLSQGRRTAFIALALMALNYDLINLTTARYDGMAAALSAIGLAAYATLREHHLSLALFTANACMAAAAMTHPYGVLGFGYLLILFLSLDRMRFRPSYLAVAAIPYIIALVGWGLYISQDVGIFKSQFFTNAQPHKTSLLHPLSLLVSELHDRYWVLFAGMRSGVPVYMRLKLGILVLYLISFIAAELTPTIRKNKGDCALLICATFGFVALAIGEGSRLYNYLVHVIAFYSVVLAIYLRHFASLGRPQRAIAAIIVCGVGGFTVASIFYRVRLNSYNEAYLPAARYLSQHVNGAQLVFAGGEFVFPLSFDRHLLDDQRLGYGNKRHADYIVVGNAYDFHFQRQRLLNPKLYGYLEQIQHSYRLVFASRAGLDYYRVYASPDLPIKQISVDKSNVQPIHAGL